MEEEGNSIEINLFFRGIGKVMCHMVQVDRSMLMVRYMKESGWMVKCKEKVFFSVKMVLHIQVNGLTIYNMVMAIKNGKQVFNTKVISQKD